MSIITKATHAKPVKTPDAQKVIYTYVIVLVVFLVCQLFTFDEFIRLLESFWLPGGLQTAHFLASSIVISELFALPFLLRMDLSPLMRVLSMILSWMVPIIWLALSLWMNLTVNAISNVGFLGMVVDIVPGWWVICISIALGLMAIWSSWALWPTKAKK